MPTLVDVIDTYEPGSSGTITDSLGVPVNYTVSGNATTTNGNVYVYDDDSAQVYAGEYINSHFDVTFEQPVVGVLLEMRGSDLGETFGVRINGQLVDLNVLIAEGKATFTAGGTGNHYLTSNGQLSSTGIYNDGSIGYVQFHMPITQVGVVGTTTQPDKVNGFDTFEIGIVPDATVVCFCDGTLIDTPDGPRAVETLRQGDLVLTLDHGAQPIRWIGSTGLDRVDLTLAPKRKPVLIRAGALGAGLPRRDLMVSRQHRILFRTNTAVDRFGTDELLIPAIKLVGRPGIEIVEDAADVRYWHILLDRHELLFSEGSLTESLYTGREAKKSLSAAAREELTALGFWDEDTDQPVAMVRPEIRNTRSLREFWSDYDQTISA